MGQRNRTVDLEMEQQSQASIQPELCIVPGFPQPDNNSPVMITTLGSVPNLEPHGLQEPPYDNSAMFYGLPQYHNVQNLHQTATPHAGISSNAPSFYLPYVAFQAPPSQFPSSSSHGVVGVTSDEYNSRGTYKRKNAEGIPGNSHYLSTASAPCSFTPFNTSETTPFVSSNPQLGQRSTRNRPGAVPLNPPLPHGPNSFIQGSYAGLHPFPPLGSIWYDQHQINNGRSDGAPSFWPHAPYMHGNSIVTGSIDSGNVCLPRFHDSSRNPTAFMYPSQLNQRDHFYSPHHPAPPPVQGMRGQNATVYPHMASASYRVPHGNYDGSEIGSSHVGPVQPTGFRIYPHQQRDDTAPLGNLRHRGVPRLRVMPTDEVAVLEFGDFLGNNHVDHHRDMRLDIEEMSYEELLALSERIGTVNTGLPEEAVKNHLKTRTCFGINLEESPPTDTETDSCTICQENYENQEKIATLDCGHEYHAECLEKWLVVKNVCPICKSEALVMEKRRV